MLPGPLQKNDNFPFECLTCGECCSGTMEVFLNPMDVIILAKHLKMNNTKDLWEDGYIVTAGGQNGTLIPRLKFAGLSPGFCPFVVNNWDEETSCLKGTCSIHGKAKPLICRLAPIAREVDLDENEEEYFLKEPVIGCPGCKEQTEVNVGSYVETLGPELDLEKRWFTLLKTGLDRKVSPEDMLKKFFYIELPADPAKLMTEWEKDPLFSCC
ncbi:MAG: YkgJ family cysteine cluster protein [Spirochaetales bacterium]|nr:YkgJ family cysteine cluster protein [Spirochaetales bacterium]